MYPDSRCMCDQMFSKIIINMSHRVDSFQPFGLDQHLVDILAVAFCDTLMTVFVKYLSRDLCAVQVCNARVCLSGGGAVGQTYQLIRHGTFVLYIRWPVIFSRLGFCLIGSFDFAYLSIILTTLTIFLFNVSLCKQEICKFQVFPFMLIIQRSMQFAVLFTQWFIL